MPTRLRSIAIGCLGLALLCPVRAATADSFGGQTRASTGAVATGAAMEKNTIRLATRVRQPHPYTIYYGWLTPNVLDWQAYDFVVVADRDASRVARARSEGAVLFQYLTFGSQFADDDAWLGRMEATIQGWQQQGLAQGLFLDECDIDYWHSPLPDAAKERIFGDRLQALADYAAHIGLPVIINGAPVFAHLGTYYLWENNLTTAAGQAKPFTYGYADFLHTAPPAGGPGNWSNTSWTLDYLRNMQPEPKVLSHSYGPLDDLARRQYAHWAAQSLDLWAADYSDPDHQAVEDAGLLQEPLGLLLDATRSGDTLTAHFTGATVVTDFAQHTSAITRDEPAYWYGKAKTIDGDLSDWASTPEAANRFPGRTGRMGAKSWGAAADYNAGTFVGSTTVTTATGAYVALDPGNTTGVGTWTSQVFTADTRGHWQWSDVVWGGRHTTVTYRTGSTPQPDATWSDWAPLTASGITYPMDRGAPYVQFQARLAPGDASDPPAFWGIYLRWVYLVDPSIALAGLSLDDDRANLYVKVRTVGAMRPDSNNYDVYLDTDLRTATGYRLRINADQGALYAWNFVRSDWEYAGVVDCRAAEDRTGAECAVPKFRLGSALGPTLRVKGRAEHPPDWSVDLLPSDSSSVLYTQKVFDAYAPHGAYCGGAVWLGHSFHSARINWQQTAPAGSSVAVYLRFFHNNQAGPWQRVDVDTTVDAGFAATGYQYMVALSTTAPDLTPTVTLPEVITDSAAAPIAAP